jgi:hypothetical protein
MPCLADTSYASLRLRGVMDNVALTTSGTYSQLSSALYASCAAVPQLVAPRGTLAATMWHAHLCRINKILDQWI